MRGESDGKKAKKCAMFQYLPTLLIDCILFGTFLTKLKLPFLNCYSMGDTVQQEAKHLFTSWEIEKNPMDSERVTKKK